jgi:uncharacterized membrane protein
MNGKIFALAFFSIITILSFASALSMSVSNDLGAGQNATVTLVNNDAFNQTITFSPVSPYTASSGIVYSYPASVSLNSGQSTSFSISASIVPSALKFGKYAFTLTANGVDKTNSSNTVSTTAPVTFDESFCRSGAIGNNLSITTVDIRDTASGSDDTAWTLLDTVTVKVKAENLGDSTVRSVIFELGLYDDNGVNRVNDLTFINSDQEKISYGSIKSGNDASVTFQFQVPASLNSGTYRLAVKAYSDSIGQNFLCADSSSDLGDSTFQSVDINTQDSVGKYIAFDNVQITPTDVTCGDTITLTADAYNVGDQDEDRVRITAFNQDLKLSSLVDISGGMAQGDSAPVSFTFSVPQNAQNKVYPISLYADYEYTSGVYKQRSTNPLLVNLNVIGCQSSQQQTTSANVSLSAALTSTAVAGQPLDVSAIVTNTGSTLASYTLDASGYDSWATLSSVSSRLITLDAGQTKQVTFELVPNKNAAGQQSFVISAMGANAQVTSRQVVVTLGESSGFSFGGSNLIWTIAAINLVLLLVIIFVAVKLSRR